jgi:hypothetical protein
LGTKREIQTNPLPPDSPPWSSPLRPTTPILPMDRHPAFSGMGALIALFGAITGVAFQFK